MHEARGIPQMGTLPRCPRYRSVHGRAHRHRLVMRRAPLEGRRRGRSRHVRSVHVSLDMPSAMPMHHVSLDAPSAMAIYERVPTVHARADSPYALIVNSSGVWEQQLGTCGSEARGMQHAYRHAPKSCQK